MRSVLVTDSGSGLARSSLAAVRAARSGGYAPVVATWGRSSLAAASNACERVVSVPPPDAPAFAAAIEAEVEARGHLDVLAASDTALRALRTDVGHLIDKPALADRARAVGLRAPDSRTFSSVDELAADIEAGAVELPVVVKPPVSTWPARLVASIDDVAALTDVGTSVEMGGGEQLLVQPVLRGRLESIACVIHGGEAIGAVGQMAVRTWPRAAGTSCFATTTAVEDERLERIVAMAAPYEGILQVQFLDGHVIDANPRVFGSLPLAVKAGVNLVAMHLDVLAGEAVRRVRAQPGAVYRWIEGDVRHVLDGVRRRDLSLRAALAALAPRRGAAHSVEELRDLGPALARLRYAVRRR